MFIIVVMDCDDFCFFVKIVYKYMGIYFLQIIFIYIYLEVFSLQDEI